MAAPRVPGHRRAGPLANVRVLDLTMVWAGPHGTLMLAALGAEVIKLEAPRRMDTWRGATRPLPGQGVYPGDVPGERAYNRYAYFNETDRNKLGVSLDLTTAKGRLIFENLVRLSDVVIENFRAGVLERLGYPYAALCRLKGDIIYLSMPAFGNTGPERDYVAIGVAQDQLAGIAYGNGYEGDSPWRTSLNYADPVAGLTAAGAILAALIHRRRTGRGQFIDLSQREALACLVGETILDYVMNGRVPRRMGNHHQRVAPHNTYPSTGEDSWITIAVTSDKEFAALCSAMGRPELARDPRFGDMAARKRNEAVLDELIRDWTRRHDATALMRQLQRLDVPAAPVLHGGQLLSDPHLSERSFFETVTHPEAGTHPYPGSPFKLSRSPARLNRPAPRFGEHTRYVLGEVLGLGQDNVEALIAEGVCGPEPVDQQGM
ncbi:MAG: CoA transferase [Chloroflexi bacterium]|nr:CoA transferase [Chloroflexota bacterium]